MSELDIGPDAFQRDSWNWDFAGAVQDAIDLASDQGQTTWLTEGGKRIAAIVPVDLAETIDKTLTEVDAMLSGVTERAELADTLRRLATAVERSGS